MSDIRVAFFIGDNIETSHVWPQVPAVGEHIRLGLTRETRLLCVTKVIWSHSTSGECCAEVYSKEVKK
jgi:hypothetical protein